jgi:type IV pilus assembly protein PilA
MLKDIKNNQGFTLIELLAVITILILLMTIAMPSIVSLLGRTNNKISEDKKEIFISAAREYVSDNYNSITSSSCYIKPETLYNLGYLSENTYKSNGEIAINGYVKYTYNNGQDSFEYTTSGGTLCLTS